MADLTFEKEITGLVLIDPYNDFISEGGKIWDRIKGIAESNRCVPNNMLRVLKSRANRRATRLLCHAPSLPSRGLRNLEVHCSNPKSSLVRKVLRVWHMGRRNPL